MLEDIDECNAYNWADAVDRAQVRNMCLALWACLDQFLDALINVRNELIEAHSHCFEIGGESVHALERHR